MRPIIEKWKQLSPELQKRLAWGVGAALVVVLVLLVLPAEITLLVALGCALQGWREYARMMSLDKREGFYFAGYFMIVLMIGQGYFMSPSSFFWVWATWLIAFVVLFVEKVQSTRLKIEYTFDAVLVWRDLCRFVLGVLYIYMIFGFIGPIAARLHGAAYLILVFSVVFVGDTAAYFVGKKKGKSKLWPELSPGKTVEGALGGWAVAFTWSLVLWLIYRFGFGLDLGIFQCLGLGLVAPLLGIAGDFLESLMKRATGAKDSGSLLPGHGGLLDRVDGLVFVMPLAYFLF